MKYSIYRYWTCHDSVEIEAESLDEAIEIAREHPVTVGDIIPESLQVDRYLSEVLRDLQSAMIPWTTETIRKLATSKSKITKETQPCS